MVHADHCVSLSLESPSEEEMAAWLYPIVRGEVEAATSIDQPVCGDFIHGTTEDTQLVLASTNATLKAKVNKCNEVCICVENAKSCQLTASSSKMLLVNLSTPSELKFLVSRN